MYIHVQKVDGPTNEENVCIFNHIFFSSVVKQMAFAILQTTTQGIDSIFH